MLPRSGSTCERMSVPRSSTCPICSSPSQILMLSTAVSMAGKVLITFSMGVPISNG